MIKKNLLIFVTIVLFFILFLVPSCYAADTVDLLFVDNTGNSTDEYILKGYNRDYLNYFDDYNYIVRYVSDTYQDIIFIPEDTYCYTETFLGVNVLTFSSDNTIVFSFNNGVWTYDTSVSAGQPGISTCIYFATDIYTSKSKTNYFFEIPVVVYPKVIVEPTGVIAPLLEVKTMKQTLKEIVAILPLILVLLVSLHGLMKGLKTIKNLIHSA